MEQDVALAVVVLVAGGVAAQWLAFRFALPAIVILFAAGLLVGPGLGLIDPSEAMGHNLHALIGLAVALIVFEGGLALNFKELRAAGQGVVRLTVVALPVNWLLGALAAAYIGGLDWGASILFGAIMVVTGPTVILPLLRQARLERRSASFLKWEAILNDPAGAILAAAVLEFLILFQFGDDEALLEVALRLGVGLAVGVALGVGAAFLVRRLFVADLTPEILKTPMLLALALSVYALANLAISEAGLVAATVFGLTLANIDVPGLSELKRFKEGLVVLIVSTLFIVLVADLDTEVFLALSWPIVLLTLAMLLVVRPLAIALATIGSDLDWRERVLTGAIAPRGIVAAAVAGLAGARLAEVGYDEAALIEPTVFAVIATTVVVHGFALPPLARALGLSKGDDPAVAIIGASDWAVDLSRALGLAKVRVVLIDTFPGAAKRARRAGISAIQTQILSEEAEDRLADSPIDYALVATKDDVYNALVSARLGPDLGRERVFQLPAAGDVDLAHELDRDWRGKLFGRLPFAEYERRFEAGWRFAAEPATRALAPQTDEAGLVFVRGGRILFDSLEAQDGSGLEDGIAVVFLPPEEVRGREVEEEAAGSTSLLRSSVKR
ncbi:cation:proton antiporter [Salinarimonas ramus]|uniref:Sodium/hydrogen exchanger n=1 Tax=Salinarimonas ramus TaxID=690164 RepID=A0A917QKI5_9HYPH|nr:sodium:proton antiporter [Salinarimonas ramus]GGK55469.1 sodium/hydrogen exchanger [Salinarimonas ramus]